MSAELIFARLFKGAAVAAASFTCFVLVSSMVRMTCPLKAYPPGVLAAMYVSLLMLIVYSKFKFSSYGMVRARIPMVRRAFIAIVALEFVGIGIVLALRGDCPSIVRAVPVPGALLIFYTAVIFSLIFGDSYLGALRNVVRLGVKPIDFMRDSDLK